MDRIFKYFLKFNWTAGLYSPWGCNELDTAQWLTHTQTRRPVKSVHCSVMSNSLWPHGLQPTRLLYPRDFLGKNTWVGSHSLLQGIFPTQRLNLCLRHFRQNLYHCSDKPARCNEEQPPIAATRGFPGGTSGKTRLPMQKMQDVGSIPGLGRSPGGGHGSPLQYSCLENPMDRGAWRATVQRVTKSWTQLKQLSMNTCVLQLERACTKAMKIQLSHKKKKEEFREGKMRERKLYKYVQVLGGNAFYSNMLLC